MRRLPAAPPLAAATAAGVAAPIASAVGSAATCPGSGIVRGALRATDGLSLAVAIAWPGSGSGSGSAPSRTTSTAGALRATSASASTLGATTAFPAADAARAVLRTSIACTDCGTTAAAATAAGVAAPIASAVGSAATCPGGGIVRGALRATGVVALQLRLRPQSRWGPDRLRRGIRSHLPWRWHSAGRPQSHGRSRLAAAISAPIALRPRSPPPWDPGPREPRTDSSLQMRLHGLAAAARPPVPPQRLAPSEPRPRPLVPSELRLPSPPPTQRAPSLRTSIACTGCGTTAAAATAAGVAAPIASAVGSRSHLPWRWHSARRPHSHGRSRLAAAIAAPIALGPRSPPPWDSQPPALAVA